MINHDRWRDQQIAGFTLAKPGAILAQEQIMLNFIKEYNICWKWLGNNTTFKNICQQEVCINDSNAQGVIVFGKILNQLTTKKLVEKITNIIKDFDYVYVAVNRYEILYHDIDLILPDSIAESIDTIMNFCNPQFKRLHTFDQVDGNHMVAAHPMDCYGLCKL